MFESLVFFIPFIAIKVKSVSEEIQSVWCVTLGKIREVVVKISAGFHIMFHKAAFLCAEK